MCQLTVNAVCQSDALCWGRVDVGADSSAPLANQPV